MSDVTFRSDFTVRLVDHMGSEEQICRVARVTDSAEWPPLPGTGQKQRDAGLMRMLMRDRHGTPWESVVLQFYIETPIFLNREFFRHRIASFNETSARYRVLQPVFYTPPAGRPLVQEGKPGAYTFAEGEPWQASTVEYYIGCAAETAWVAYEEMLKAGIAKEVARNVLPVNIYSPFYVTMNLRAFFNFLSLRHVNEHTTVPTFPQWEIDQVAGEMEKQVELVLPRAMALFNEHGRVAP